ncbi:MAG: HypC/HybG/HupF family hydrogenase formation chaperone [Armatimonadia bacterium]|nr:HypC/HybG/HupF family hydrogenase formation chaperone [Armatimonadia bacterium]
MCIAVPCRLVAADELWGEVAVGDSRMKIRLDLLEEAELGDWVLVHAGFAIERLDEEEAKETLALLDEAARAAAASDETPPEDGAP